MEVGGGCQNIKSQQLHSLKGAPLTLRSYVSKSPNYKEKTPTWRHLFLINRREEIADHNFSHKNRPGYSGMECGNVASRHISNLTCT
jgi:hypothetical protein